MGEIADGLIDGEFDFYTGEYLGKGVGFPRTRNGSLPWEKRKNNKNNPRRGVIQYVHNSFAGKSHIPSAIKIIKKYAAEVNLVFKTEEEMFQLISADFTSFVNWFNKNKQSLYHVH